MRKCLYGLLLVLAVGFSTLPGFSHAQDGPPAAAAPSPAPPPADVPLDRVGWLVGAALVINRLLQLLKRMQAVFPAKWKPYLPLVAAGLGFVAGALDLMVNGSPWYIALITGVVGASGAVFVREAGRAVKHARTKPPKAGGDMDDDELADAVAEG